MDQAVSRTPHEAGVAKRLAKYTAAAGLGSFAFGNVADAAITTVVAPDFLTKSLVGNPYYPAPIEDAYYPGNFPFRSIGWATEGFSYQYGGYYNPNVAFGMDLDGNGTGDINFFRGGGYGGYLIASSGTGKVGYAYAPVYGSGQATILSNDTENPDIDGFPSPSASKRLLQGFAAWQMIGDGNDVSIGNAEGVMRDAYSVGDWDGVPDNLENLYGSGNPADPSYIGFQITGLSTGTGSGFGWIEVAVREGTVPGFLNPSHPELQILRWAFTDDGTPLAAGDTGVLAGDLNGDGFVGVDDLNIVLVNWNQNVTPGDLGAGDPTGEGFVGVDDLNIVLVNWNNGTPPPPAAAIPEPTTLMLLAVGAGSVALRRKPRKA